MTDFRLDPRLHADTTTVLDLPLCRLLMMRAVDHPWLILVPRQPGLVEILDLSDHDRRWLFDEIARVAEALKAETGAHKLNIGALGNVVSQLHVHVIARFRDDPAWPNPVWGRPTERPRGPELDAALAERLRARLA
jgi:diadenosine tetraphosphate (Ap4A) HIT family hydrolase